MGNIFYAPGDQRAERVKALFARIAARYDLINDLQSFGLHRYWKARVIKIGCCAPGQTALDICCGTADLSLALARRGLKVVGLDFCEQMLNVAQVRGSQRLSVTPKRGEAPSETQSKQLEDEASNKAHSRPGTLSFVRADAQQVPFPDNTFDIVIVGYGLRNLADWRTGLREMERVARPGGRLLVLDFGKPDNRFWRGLYFGYLKLFVPWLGRIFCGDASAYGYILESLKHYPAQRGVAEAMREMRLSNVRVVNLLGGIMSINYAEKEGSLIQEIPGHDSAREMQSKSL